MLKQKKYYNISYFSSGKIRIYIYLNNKRKAIVVCKDILKTFGNNNILEDLNKKSVSINNLQKNNKIPWLDLSISEKRKRPLSLSPKFRKKTYWTKERIITYINKNNINNTSQLRSIKLYSISKNK